jgi:hypothetical protein
MKICASIGKGIPGVKSAQSTARQGGGNGPLGFGAFSALFLALFALALLPLTLSEIPPLLDYPNHLARMFLLAHLDSTPVLQQFYAVAWAPLPDLAMDATVPPLLAFLPLDIAGKVFIGATFLLLAGGTALLQRALFQRWSAWPCLAFLLLYNRMLLWGFLNYLFGLGLALSMLAVWIMLRRHSVVWRLIFGCVAALVIYFAHLMAFGIYGVLIAGTEIGLWRRRQGSIADLAVAALPFLPPLLIFVATSGAASAGRIVFGNPWRKFDLLFSVFDNYSRPFDVACFVIAVIGVGFLYGCRWARLAPGMAWPLGLLGIAYLAMPSEIFTATGADHRLPLALALVLIGASRFDPPRAIMRRTVYAAGLALFLLRAGVVAVEWQASGRAYAALLPGLDLLEPGSRVAVGFPDRSVHVDAIPLLHLPVLAVARREAFVPTLFASAAQQPIRLTPPAQTLADQLSATQLWAHFVGGGDLDAATQAALRHYDYLVLTGRADFSLSTGAGLDPVFVVPRFQIYRVTHS